MVAEVTALSVAFVTAFTEWMHVRRCRRIARLAFGPSGKPQPWTGIVPVLRVVSLTFLSWGLVVLFLAAPRSLKSTESSKLKQRHLVIALDVSPSMQLKDAGLDRQKTRAQRAGELILSILERTSLEDIKVSVIAFYTGAKPVVTECKDLDVIKNILNDLPLDQAFDWGKTTLFDGIKESFALAKPWREGSATLLLVSDGDTVPSTGIPPLPRSIRQVVVLGVGDPRIGKFIDGHQSRQDMSTLQQIANRLNGVYHNGNEKQFPTYFVTALSQGKTVQEKQQPDQRELALIAITVTSIILSGIPMALAFAGSRWPITSSASSKISSSPSFPIHQPEPTTSKAYP